MADTKISGLTALTGANTASGDLLTIVDVSDTTMAATGTNKKITLTELQSAPVSAGTANGVLYLNGSKVATAGTALTFDGTGLGIGTGTIPAGRKLVIDSGNIRLSNDYQIEWGGSTVGLYGNGSTNSLSFFTNTSEQMRLTSTGLGIGTSSPAARLDLNASGSNAQMAVQNWPMMRVVGTTLDIGGYNASQWTQTRLYTNGNIAATLDSSGRFGIGATSLTEYLTVKSPNASTFFSLQTATDSGVYMGNNVGALTLLTASTERARIDSSGNLLVGTTSGSTNTVYRTDNSNPILLARNGSASGVIFGVTVNYSGQAPNNTASFFLQCNDTGAERCTIRSNGGIANYQANDANLSDRREKTNFAPAKDYLDTICAIPVQTFNYIDQSEDDPGTTLGVVAQDVQAVAPELVHESNWGTEEEPKMRLSIYQTDLQYALMKCIQEQQAQIESLRKRLADAGIA